MRRRPFILAGLAMLVPAAARASDLSRALTFAQDVMGDQVVEGFEDFVDTDENEALSLLLYEQVPHETGELQPLPSRVEPFQTLGNERLAYGSLAEVIESASAATGLPAALIDAVIRTESGYRPRAVSRVGAQGLMQLMPATARALGVTDAFDPTQNVMAGARYLRKMYDRFGSVQLALAAYNAGPGAVARHDGVPPFKETQRYVATVLRRYQTSPLR